MTSHRKIFANVKLFNVKIVNLKLTFMVVRAEIPDVRVVTEMSKTITLTFITDLCF